MRACLAPPLPAPKVWELQDIDVQAASRIVRSADPASVLQDISQNFPVLTSVLVLEPVNESLRDEAAFNAQTVLAPIGLEAGGSLLTINSLLIDAETADMHVVPAFTLLLSRVLCGPLGGFKHFDDFADTPTVHANQPPTRYTLLSTLRADSKLLNGLRAVGFPPSVVGDVMSLTDTSAASQVPVLDFRHSSVQWLNDLERDSKCVGRCALTPLGRDAPRCRSPIVQFVQRRRAPLLMACIPERLFFVVIVPFFLICFLLFSCIPTQVHHVQVVAQHRGPAAPVHARCSQVHCPQHVARGVCYRSDDARGHHRAEHCC